MWSKTRVAAFTLLECLLAILLISGSLLVVQGLTKLVAHEVELQTNSVDQDWLLFSDQLRKEWESARLIKVEGNRVYVEKMGQRLAFGKSRADDFRKTNDRGQGYQPMLYHLQSVTVVQTDSMLELVFFFDNGEERSFIYAFEEAG